MPGVLQVSHFLSVPDIFVHIASLLFGQMERGITALGNVTFVFIGCQNTEVVRTPPLSRMGAEERESMSVPGSKDGCDPD